MELSEKRAIGLRLVAVRGTLHPVAGKLVEGRVQRTCACSGARCCKGVGKASQRAQEGLGGLIVWRYIIDVDWQGGERWQAAIVSHLGCVGVGNDLDIVEL